MTETVLLAASLDRLAASHLHLALKNHRKWARANGYATPAALEQLEQLALAALDTTGTDISRHTPTPTTEIAPAGPKLEPMTVTVPQAAAALCVSQRSVERMVADSRIASTKVGRSRRIPQTELERLVGTRTGDTT